MLRANRGAALPDRLLVFDTETDAIEVEPGVIEARLRFGWLAMTWRHRGLRWSPPRWHRFTTPAELWDLIDEAFGERRRALLVAHNIGFDLRVCDAFRELPERGWTLRSAVIDDPPTILSWRKDRRTLRALDSLNYWRVPLSAIGAELGIEKLDMPPDAATDAVWDTYCRRDVDIVLEAMRTLMARVRQWDLGHLASTLPGQAFTAWRHRHMTVPIMIDANPAALELARDAYHGGRTEAFRIGPIVGPVRVYDVASMYPSVMATEPMPTVLLGHYRSMSVDELTSALDDYGAVARVTITTDAADYPVVHDDRLMFTTGTFRAALAAPELRHACQQQRVMEVHEVALYRQAPIFASYVAEWWDRRVTATAEGRGVDAWIAKRMLNALYGKFGQRGRVYERVGEYDPGIARAWLELDADTGEVHHFRAIGGLWQELVGHTESAESHPAIAATVTSAARMVLLALMEDAGRSHVVYVDTDSIFVLPEAQGPSERVLVRSGLGALKLERTIAELTVHGAKDYIADGRATIKGIRRDAVVLGPGRYEQDTFEGLKGAVQRGDVSRQLIRRTTKVLVRDYRKGIVGPDGIVVPLTLGL